MTFSPPPPQEIPPMTSTLVVKGKTLFQGRFQHFVDFSDSFLLLWERSLPEFFQFLASLIMRRKRTVGQNRRTLCRIGGASTFRAVCDNLIQKVWLFTIRPQSFNAFAMPPTLCTLNKI